jgi:hypothetical protein
MTTTFRHEDAVRPVDDKAELLMFAVKNGLLKGNEGEFEVYEFEGRMLHDLVIREKRRASVAAGHGLPSPLDVMRTMSTEEFSALRKRVARALWFGDRSK